MRRSRHSLAWRARRAIESATASRPLLRRTGPAWAFGALGLVGELAFAPIVLGATAVIGVLSYLLLDTPWTRMREQQRPRFVSVRILYLNTLILAGFWLAVMFAFSAADPSLTTNVSQRLPQLLDIATARDYATVLHLKHDRVGAGRARRRGVHLVRPVPARDHLRRHGEPDPLRPRRRAAAHARAARRAHRARRGCATTPTSDSSSMEKARPVR